MRRALGLIVNPVAGMGGRVGLKGTDGVETLRRAVELGAEPVSPARADRTLVRLERWRDRLAIVAGAGPLGGNLAAAHAFDVETVGRAPRGPTRAADTRTAAAEMERRDVELILYAGGDGTTRDVVDAVGDRVPVLGIPTGVKMHSGVFATSPEAAGDIAAAYVCGRPRSRRLRDAEVMDVDEEAVRSGRVSARLYATARVPDDRSRIQGSKSPSPTADAQLDAACRTLALETAAAPLTLFGPGTTTARVLAHLGLEGTLLGVDAVAYGRLAGADLGEAQLLELLDGRSAKLVVGVVGGQGYVFGRGNQQLGPDVIRRVGLDNIVVLASLEKIATLDPPTLRVDTGDPELDRELGGYRAVRIGPNRSLVIRISTGLEEDL